MPTATDGEGVRRHGDPEQDRKSPGVSAERTAKPSIMSSGTAESTAARRLAHDPAVRIGDGNSTGATGVLDDARERLVDRQQVGH